MQASPRYNGATLLLSYFISYSSSTFEFFFSPSSRPLDLVVPQYLFFLSFIQIFYSFSLLRSIELDFFLPDPPRPSIKEEEECIVNRDLLSRFSRSEMMNFLYRQPFYILHKVFVIGIENKID